MSIDDPWAAPWAKARGYCPGCRRTQTLVRRDLQRAVEHICAEGHNWFRRDNQMMHVHNVHPANLPAELQP